MARHQQARTLAVADAATAGLLLFSRRLGLTAVAAALLLAFARVYIAAHYPWDVAAGLALGATVTLLGWLLLHPPLTAAASWPRRQPALRAISTDTTDAGTVTRG